MMNKQNICELEESSLERHVKIETLIPSKVHRRRISHHSNSTPITDSEAKIQHTLASETIFNEIDTRLESSRTLKEAVRISIDSASHYGEMVKDRACFTTPLMSSGVDSVRSQVSSHGLPKEQLGSSTFPENHSLDLHLPSGFASCEIGQTYPDFNMMWNQYPTNLHHGYPQTWTPTWGLLDGFHFDSNHHHTWHQADTFPFGMEILDSVSPGSYISKPTEESHCDSPSPSGKPCLHSPTFLHITDTVTFNQKIEKMHSVKKLKKKRKRTEPQCVRPKHVGKACNHCKKAHLACDNSRPCRRCTHLGKADCMDVEHKRRGRPRSTPDKKLLVHIPKISLPQVEPEDVLGCIPVAAE